MSATIVLTPGNDGPVNDGERRVLQFLRDHLPGGFELHPNLQLGVGRGELIECDILVFGPDCVWIVEVKDLAPRVIVGEHEFLVGGEVRSHPVRTTRTKAQKIKSRLSEDPLLGGVWVQPLVVLAREPLSLDVDRTMRSYVMSMETAAAVMADPTRVGLHRDRLPADVAARAKARLALAATARRPRPKFGPYRTAELLAGAEDRTWWSATHEVMGTPVRLEVIGIDPVLTPDEQARRRTEAYRAARVRVLLGAYPWALAPETAFNADDGSVVVVHPDDPSPSLDEVDDLVAGWSDDIKRKFVQRLAITVAYCHDHDVVHRTIGPRSIFVTANNAPKLGGFARAAILRRGAGTVTPGNWGALGHEFWMAPELASGHAERAADLYALGMAVRHLWPDGAPSDLAAAAATLTDPDPRKRSITARQLADIAVADRLPPPPAPTTPGAGAVFGSRWLLQEKLGGGASGTVWKAIDTNFDKTVALKIYDRVDAGDEVQREYLALEDLSHPGIVRIRDGQRVDGKWVLVSEFLDGATLRAAMPPATEPLSWDTAASITMKLLSALQAVHPDMPRILELSARDDLTDDEQIELAKLRSKGVVHRDVKPENVVLVAERGPVLVDFGLAAAGPSGAPGGTPQYRPPGIAFEGSNPDLDLFAVGVMLHEMLTGTHPFMDSDPIGGTLRIAPGLDPAVRDLLERACSPEDAVRFHSAQEFTGALAVLGVAEVPMPVPAPHATELVAEIRRAVAEQRWDDAERLCPEDWDQVRRQISERRALAAGAEEATPLLEIDGYSITFTGTRRFDNANIPGGAGAGPGTSRVYLVRGPGSVMLEVLDQIADTGERWVQGGDAFQSPRPFSRLDHGLRMSAIPLDDRLRVQLGQARITNSEGWSKTYKASVDELDAGAGTKVEDALREHGAIDFGAQAEVFGDPSPKRNFVCVTFRPDNEHLPAVAHFLTKVMPLAHGVQAN